MTHPERLVLDADRLLPVEPTVRRIARDLHGLIDTLPIVSLHGHVDASMLASNRPFRSATELLVTDDHYVTRMMVSQGVPLHVFDWARRGAASDPESDRDVWRRFCRLWPAFRGTPSRMWIEYELVEILGVHTVPSAESADRLFDEIGERLDDPAFRPRALFDRFGIEVLATTDDPWSDLGDHAELAAGGLHGEVIPTMRPDALFEPASERWNEDVEALEKAIGARITTLEGLIGGIAARRVAFRAAGATATDHGSPTFRVEPMSPEAAERVFAEALSGIRPSVRDADAFRSHMLYEMAGLAAADGLVMQLHCGAVRDYDPAVAEVFGSNRGFDIPAAAGAALPMRPMMERFGFDGGFRCIAYTLDETTWTRELAPLAGAYPSLFLGAPWWFLDTPNAMRRYRRAVTDTAGFANTAGFVDDTRAFLSIPARHDTARRVDAGVLAEMVVEGVLTLRDAEDLAADLTTGIPNRVFRRSKENHR